MLKWSAERQNSMKRMNDNRLTEIEIKMAYQEDLIQSLNAVVADQQAQISRLEQACKILNQRIESLTEYGNINQSVEIPPHY